MLKNFFSYAIFSFGIILFLNCPAFAQTNIDSISGRFQQLSKQLADLEKYVYNNGGEGTSIISSGQQKRIDALENAVKELRGIVEVDLSLLKQEVDKINSKLKNQNLDNIQNTSSNVNNDALSQEILILKDKIRIIDSRFNSTLDLIGKSEIRIMRMESLLNSDTIAPNQIQGNISSNNNSGFTSEIPNNAEEIPSTVSTQLVGEVEVSQNENGTLGVLSVNEDENEIALNTILPDLAPEEQFKFSLDLALKRKYDEAEIALKEFMALHPNHEKNRDAHYWYGGVMFKQKKYEDSAFSDIEFNDKYPDDPRTVDTTLRIAQAMSYVAPPEQACTVFENSLNFIVDPPERFVRKINELKADKACD